MEPTVLHGKGSLAKYVTRKSDLSHFALGDKDLQDEVRNWDVEPDIVSIVEKNAKALVVLAECKSTGTLSVENLAQILLYSVVTRAYAAGIFFTGNISAPVRNLTQNHMIKYEGFDEAKTPVDHFIGLYSVGSNMKINRIYPLYEVYDI
jgi:hypothetical protein